MKRGTKCFAVAAVFTALVTSYLNLDRFFCGGDVPAKSDAVIVLAGGRYTVGRVAEGLRLVGAGFSTNLIVSGVEFDPNNANYVPAAASQLAGQSVLVDGKSRITRGSSLLARQLAVERQWPRIIVVTSEFHWLRTRALFEYDLPPGVEIRVCTVPDIDFRRWWANPYNSRILRSELLFFTTFYLFHTPYGAIGLGLLAIAIFIWRKARRVRRRN